MDDSKSSRKCTWQVSYGDQSGNRFLFWKKADDAEARFSYDPVTPEKSSSGTYSGGEPNRGTLVAAQVEALFGWVCDLERNTDLHAATRMMGTGSFRIREGDGVQRRFIVRNCAKRRAFEAFVVDSTKPWPSGVTSSEEAGGQALEEPEG